MLFLPRIFLLIRALITPVFAIYAGGCAIHPLPENVTGLNTYMIVNKIRCEARHAIKDRAIQLLLDDPVAKQAEKDAAAKSLDEHAEKWREIKLSNFSDYTRNAIDKYDDALIHMDFTLTITEENNFSSEINLLSTLTAGSNGLGLKAANNRIRKNTRNFRVKDSFGAILSAKLTCVGTSRRPDYLYPITGEIGLKEVVWTFLDLNELQNLSKGEGANLFTDTLVFTTTFDGSASPKVLLSPVGKPLSLANAGFTAEVKRTDQHEVLVGLALPEEKTNLGKAVPAARLNSLNGSFLPSARVGLSTDSSIHGYQLDQLMNFQLERNALLNLKDTRPITLTLFP